MSNKLIYSVNIYLSLFIILCSCKKDIICLNNNNKLKSWKYFCNKINNISSLDDILSLPLFTILLVIISFNIAKNI